MRCEPRVHAGGQRMRARQAEHGAELVDAAVGLDALRGLGDAPAVAEAGLAAHRRHACRCGRAARQGRSRGLAYAKRQRLHAAPRSRAARASPASCPSARSVTENAPLAFALQPRQAPVPMRRRQRALASETLPLTRTSVRCPTLTSTASAPRPPACAAAPRAAAWPSPAGRRCRRDRRRRPSRPRSSRCRAWRPCRRTRDRRPMRSPCRRAARDSSRPCRCRSRPPSSTWTMPDFVSLAVTLGRSPGRVASGITTLAAAAGPDVAARVDRRDGVGRPWCRARAGCR